MKKPRTQEPKEMGVTVCVGARRAGMVFFVLKKKRLHSWRRGGRQ